MLFDRMTAMRFLFGVLLSFFSESLKIDSMHTLRKIDLYGQGVLGVLMMLSVPFLLAYGFMFGLFFLGIWQLISAGLNTTSFIGAGQMREIIRYWKWVSVGLGMIGACFPLSMIIDPDDVQVFAAIAVVCSTPIAIHYFIIYRKLVLHFELRRSLSSIIKSKP